MQRPQAPCRLPSHLVRRTTLSKNLSISKDSTSRRVTKQQRRGESSKRALVESAMNRPPPHHGAMPLPPPPAAPGTGQLTHYASAPGSFLAALADSVTRGGGDPAPPPFTRLCSGESSGLRLTSGEPTCRTDGDGGGRPLDRAYGGSGEIRLPPASNRQQQGLATRRTTHVPHGGARGQPPRTSPLLRQSSSPAGLLSHLMADQHGV
nr:unnamed protein product [Digitaria exilis]